jgi:uncharacterized protein DUF3455
MSKDALREQDFQNYNNSTIRREFMRLMKIRMITGLCLLLTVVASATAPAARAGDNGRPLELPSPICDRLQVPAGNELAFRMYARGVQVYRWDGSAWQFVAPSATLFADPDYHAQVGVHYAGPTWQSNTGSFVKAARKADCSPDPGAIPWLLLQATATNGPGVFSSVTYVQRLDTAGGKAPAYAGSSVGESVEVPYTAVYYFYRAED